VGYFWRGNSQRSPHRGLDATRKGNASAIPRLFRGFVLSRRHVGWRFFRRWTVFARENEGKPPPDLCSGKRTRSSDSRGLEHLLGLRNHSSSKGAARHLRTFHDPLRRRGFLVHGSSIKNQGRHECRFLSTFSLFSFPSPVFALYIGGCALPSPMTMAGVRPAFAATVPPFDDQTADGPSGPSRKNVLFRNRIPTDRGNASPWRTQGRPLRDFVVWSAVRRIGDSEAVIAVVRGYWSTTGNRNPMPGAAERTGCASTLDQFLAWGPAARGRTRILLVTSCRWHHSFDRQCGVGGRWSPFPSLGMALLVTLTMAQPHQRIEFWSRKKATGMPRLGSAAPYQSGRGRPVEGSRI